MSINQRIKQYVNHLHLTPNSFSRSIGLNNNVSISKIIRGDGQPSFSTLEKIKSTYPELNMNWLISGEGQMLIEEVEHHLLEDMQKIIQDQKEHNKILMKALDLANKREEKK